MEKKQVIKFSQLQLLSLLLQPQINQQLWQLQQISAQD